MPDTPDVPDVPDDESTYHIPLPELTGKYGYARQRGPDDPPDPGAPVAYVAEHVRDRKSALTIEGAIIGIGDAAYNAAREGGDSARLMRFVAFAFVVSNVAALLLVLVNRL